MPFRSALKGNWLSGNASVCSAHLKYAEDLVFDPQIALFLFSMFGSVEEEYCYLLP